jgi:hypothetical protein
MVRPQNVDFCDGSVSNRLYSRKQFTSGTALRLIVSLSVAVMTAGSAELQKAPVPLRIRAIDGGFRAVLSQIDDGIGVVPGVQAIRNARCVVIKTVKDYLLSDMQPVVMRWVQQMGQSAVLLADERADNSFIDVIREAYGSVLIEEVLTLNIGTQSHQWLFGAPYFVLDLEQVSAWYYSRPPFREYVQGSVAVWGCADIATAEQLQLVQLSMQHTQDVCFNGSDSGDHIDLLLTRRRRKSLVIQQLRSMWFDGGVTVPLLFTFLTNVTTARQVVEGRILHYGTLNARRQFIFEQLEQRGESVALITSVVGQALIPIIQQSAVVISPMFYTGYVFACFMRIVQSISHGVAVVSESGWVTDDPLERLAGCLGGVYFLPYDQLVEGTLQILASNRTRLTDRQVDKWNRFHSQMLSWDGTGKRLMRLTHCTSYHTLA